MNKLLIAILALSIYSCKNLGDTNNPDKNSQAIYNLALDNTTGSDTFLRYHLNLPPMASQIFPISKDDSIKRFQFMKWQDSLKKILDTAELFVVVDHQFYTLLDADRESIQETFLSNKNNLAFKMQGDTTFNEALKNLCNNEFPPDTLDATKLRTKFNYRIYSDRAFPKDKVRQIGAVSFSKIAFSNNGSKAVVYTTFVCGDHCGSEQVLFFEKADGIWKYTKSWDRWVS